MIFTDGSTYYDILDATPDASPQEIRAAYMRAKGAYTHGSVATYSLMGAEDTDEMLARIEEAYRVLSNPAQRKEYDRSHGFLLVDEQSLRRPGPPRNQKIVSIDRVPPMAMDSGDESLLVSPPTDFGDSPFATSEAPLPTARRQPSFEQEEPVRPAAPTPTPAPQPAPAPQSYAHRPPAPARHDDPALIQEIAVEVEWRGQFLKKIREARHISLEEIADYTKVSKTYILAIEDEAFAKLPAAVFVRGFVTQYAKLLKLPHEKVVAAFIARFNQARPSK